MHVFFVKKVYNYIHFFHIFTGVEKKIKFWCPFNVKLEFADQKYRHVIVQGIFTKEIGREKGYEKAN